MTEQTRVSNISQRKKSKKKHSKVPNNSKFILRVWIGLEQQMKIRTVVDLQKLSDIQHLVGHICSEIQLPHLDQMQLFDFKGNQIETFAQLMQAEEASL